MHDLAARGMHGVGHHLVFVRLPFRVVMAAPPGMGRAAVVRGNAAGHDQAYAAPGALGVKGGHAVETVLASSRPTCMEPISTRFFRVVKPKSRGA